MRVCGSQHPRRRRLLHPSSPEGQRASECSELMRDILQTVHQQIIFKAAGQTIQTAFGHNFVHRLRNSHLIALLIYGHALCTNIVSPCVSMCLRFSEMAIKTTGKIVEAKSHRMPCLAYAYCNTNNNNNNNGHSNLTKAARKKICISIKAHIDSTGRPTRIL